MNIPALIVAYATGNVPRELREQPPGAPSPAQVQADPGHHRGELVRWGGEILGLRNGVDSTEVEVFARALSFNGEPRPDGGDRVRFIARVKGFLDPAEYRPDKRLTVRGALGEPITRPVGEFAYLYPVVEVGVFHLWPAYEPPAAYGVLTAVAPPSVVGVGSASSVWVMPVLVLLLPRRAP